jgi:hypothetical protein
MHRRRLVRTAPRNHGLFTGFLLFALVPLGLTACRGSNVAESQWSGPTIVAGRAALLDVSCPTPLTCVAIDRNGGSEALKQGRWTAALPVTGAGSSFDDAIVAVSCGAARSCAAAVTNGDVPLYDGTTWSASSVVDRDGHLTGLSCPTSRFCVTVDDAGEVLTYDRTWSAPIDVDDGGDLVSVSCTSPHFCLAVSEDSPATTYRFDGATWSSVAVPNPSTPQGGSEPNVLSWVSCATSKYCVALDDFGEAFIWNGRDWSGAIAFDKDLRDGSDAVSCPSLDFCMIVDDNGIAVALSDGTLGPRTQLDSEAVGLNSVSCATATRCVAVGDKGRVYIFNSRSSQ